MIDTNFIQMHDMTSLKWLAGKGADLNHFGKQCFAWKL